MIAMLYFALAIFMIIVLFQDRKEESQQNKGRGQAAQRRSMQQNQTKEGGEGSGFRTALFGTLALASFCKAKKPNFKTEPLDSYLASP